LSRFDRHLRKSSSFGADLVCSNGANGVNDPCVVDKAVDFLPCAVNLEFAICFDQGGAPKVEGAQAVMNNVGLKNGLSLAEKHLTQTLSVGQVGSGKSSEGFSVADGDEI
jgi:hypothetical protein